MIVKLDARGNPVRVRDLGTVTDSSDIQTNIVRTDGQRSVYLRVNKQPIANTVDVVDARLAPWRWKTYGERRFCQAVNRSESRRFRAESAEFVGDGIDQVGRNRLRAADNVIEAGQVPLGCTARHETDAEPQRRGRRDRHGRSSVMNHAEPEQGVTRKLRGVDERQPCSGIKDREQGAEKSQSWYIGSQPAITDSLDCRNARRIISWFCIRLRCVTITPFGGPVVPDV